MKLSKKANYTVTIDDAIFTIKPLSAKRYFELQDTLDFTLKDGETKIRNYSSYSYNIVKSGLCGWSEIYSEDNVLIPFPKNIDEALDMLPSEVIMELASKIMEKSVLSKAEEGN